MSGSNGSIRHDGMRVQETELDQPAPQRIALDAEQLRGVGLISRSTFHRLTNQLAFDFCQGYPPGR